MFGEVIKEQYCVNSLIKSKWVN